MPDKFKDLVNFLTGYLDFRAVELSTIASMMGYSQADIRRAVIIAFRTSADVIEKYPFPVGPKIDLKRVKELSDESYQFHLADTEK